MPRFDQSIHVGSLSLLVRRDTDLLAPRVSSHLSKSSKATAHTSRRESNKKDNNKQTCIRIGLGRRPPDHPPCSLTLLAFLRMRNLGVQSDIKCRFSSRSPICRTTSHQNQTTGTHKHAKHEKTTKRGRDERKSHTKSNQVQSRQGKTRQIQSNQIQSRQGKK